MQITMEFDEYIDLKRRIDNLSSGLNYNFSDDIVFVNNRVGKARARLEYSIFHKDSEELAKVLQELNDIHHKLNDICAKVA